MSIDLTSLCQEHVYRDRLVGATALENVSLELI